MNKCLMQLHLNFVKEGSGIPLIILHGLFGAKENFRQVATFLTDLFCVYRLDLRNHGASPHEPSMSYPEMAQDIVNFMKWQNIEDAVFLGHSMGGKVAMEVAVTYPKLVKRLIIADIAPVTYQAKHEYVLKGFLALKDRKFNTRLQADSELSKYIEEVSVRQFLLTNLIKKDQNLYWRINIPVLIKDYNNIAKTISEGTYDKDCLFIRGGKSDYIRDFYFSAIFKQFPNAKIETISNAGHWLHAEFPEEFSGICRRFLGG